MWHDAALEGAMPSRGAFRFALAAFVSFLALTLLTVVDIRRGFLFAAYPVRTLFYVLTPAHAAMLVIGLAGASASYVSLRGAEDRLSDAAAAVRPLALIIAALLVVDLFAYRAVPAARSIAAGRVNIDWLDAFGVSGWLRPAAQATSYLLNVWHATLIGILMSGLTLTILTRWIEPYLVRQRLAGSLFGALFALPQPFCSCCSSVMAPSLVRRGASTNFILAFVLGAPLVNVTTIVLAIALMPARFAALRIGAGIAITVIVTAVVARLVPPVSTPTAPSPDRKSTRL